MAGGKIATREEEREIEREREMEETRRLKMLNITGLLRLTVCIRQTGTNIIWKQSHIHILWLQ